MRSARGYGDLKAATAPGRGRDAGAACASATPTCAATRQRLDAILAEGAEKARAMARETLADVRAAMGFGRRAR